MKNKKINNHGEGTSATGAQLRVSQRPSARCACVFAWPGRGVGGGILQRRRNAPPGAGVGSDRNPRLFPRNLGPHVLVFWMDAETVAEQPPQLLHSRHASACSLIPAPVLEIS